MKIYFSYLLCYRCIRTVTTETNSMSHLVDLSLYLYFIYTVPSCFLFLVYGLIFTLMLTLLTSSFFVLFPSRCGDEVRVPYPQFFPEENDTLCHSLQERSHSVIPRGDQKTKGTEEGFSFIRS